MIEVKRLEVFEVAAWEEQIGPYIRLISARSNGRYAPEHIMGWAKSGEWQIWLVIEDGEISFVGGTEVTVYPTGLRSLTMHFATGSGRKRWQERVLDVIEFGRAQGCTRFESNARKGWYRVLVKFMPWLTHTHDHIEGEI